MSTVLEDIRASRIIAAVRNQGELERACASCAQVIFLLNEQLMGLEQRVRRIQKPGRRVLLHIDLCEGLGRDAAAVDYCAQVIRPDGIISTRAPLIKRASLQGLSTVQRLFLVDTQGLVNGVKLLHGSECDMIEVLPGLIPKAISFLSGELDKPIIAGGMVTTLGEVQQAWAAGAIAVSTSESALWDKIRNF